MAVVAIKIKAMPEGIGLNFENIKKDIQESLARAGSIKINSIEEEEVAFGLKALIILISWPEEKATEEAEKAVKVPGISSVEIVDYRRAFG